MLMPLRCSLGVPMRWTVISMSLALALLVPCAAFAALPATFAVQGALYSAGGGPVADGAYALQLSLLSEANPAKAQVLHTEFHIGVPVQNGAFALTMGNLDGQPPMSAAAIAAVDVPWLQVKVGAEPPLPAVPLYPVATALRAAVADQAQTAISADSAKVALAAQSLQCTGCIGLDQVSEGVLAAQSHKAIYAGQPATVQAAISDMHGRIGAFEAGIATQASQVGLGGVPNPACGVELGDSCQQGKPAMMVMIVGSEQEMLAINGTGAMVFRTDLGAFFGKTPDAWRKIRFAPYCGDGIVDEGEACDDGQANALAPDACRPDCTLPVCGDGVTDGGEVCDDGNGDDTDGCVQGCVAASCGDGFVQAGVEVCDDGNAADNDACVQGCVLNTCGDGFVHAGVEECDDGNNVDGDGCDNACKSEKPANCHAIGYGSCPTGATEWCTDDPISKTSSAQAKLACETCLGKACSLSNADCAGPGWGESASSGEPHWGYASGCSGPAGRVWQHGSSYTSFGNWAN